MALHNHDDRLNQQKKQLAPKAGLLGGRPSNPNHPFGVPAALQSGRAGYRARQQASLAGIRSRRQPGDAGYDPSLTARLTGPPTEDLGQVSSRPGFDPAIGRAITEEQGRQQLRERLGGIGNVVGAAGQAIGQGAAGLAGTFAARSGPAGQLATGFEAVNERQRDIAARGPQPAISPTDQLNADRTFEEAQEQARARLNPRGFGLEGLSAQTPGRSLSQSGVLTPEQTFTTGTPDAIARRRAELTGVDQNIAAGSLTPLQQEQSLSQRLLGGRTGVQAQEERQAAEAADAAVGTAFAGAPSLRARSAFGGSISDFARQRKDLEEKVRAGLSGEDLGQADASIGAFRNPELNRLTNTQALQAADTAFRDHRGGRRETVGTGQGSPLTRDQDPFALDQGQVDNIRDRQQDLGRRELRRGLLGMGREHRLSDAEADSELRKQSIMARLSGDPNAEITEEEHAALGRNPMEHPAAQQRLAIANTQIPEGIAALGNLQQRLGGGPKVDVKNKTFVQPTLAEQQAEFTPVETRLEGVFSEFADTDHAIADMFAELEKPGNPHGFTKASVASQKEVILEFLRKRHPDELEAYLEDKSTSKKSIARTKKRIVEQGVSQFGLTRPGSIPLTRPF